MASFVPKHTTCTIYSYEIGVLGVDWIIGRPRDFVEPGQTSQLIKKIHINIWATNISKVDDIILT